MFLSLSFFLFASVQLLDIFEECLDWVSSGELIAGNLEELVLFWGGISVDVFLAITRDDPSLNTVDAWRS